MVLNALLQRAANGYVLTLATEGEEQATYVFPSYARALQYLHTLAPPAAKEVTANEQSSVGS